jgi:hypothetical protein
MISLSLDLMCCWKSEFCVPVIFKDIHTEFSPPNKITFSKLDKASTFSHALPRRMKQFTREGIEHQIDSLPIRLAHQVGEKGIVAGVEYTVARNVELVLEIRDLFFISSAHVDLGLLSIWVCLSEETILPLRLCIDKVGLLLIQHHRKPSVSEQSTY